MQCYIVSIMLTKDSLFSTFSQFFSFFFFSEISCSSPPPRPSFSLIPTTFLRPCFRDPLLHIINHAQAHPQFVHHDVSFMLSQIICDLA